MRGKKVLATFLAMEMCIRDSLYTIMQIMDEERVRERFNKFLSL